MNWNILLGLFVAVALALGAFTTVQMAAGQCDFCDAFRNDTTTILKQQAAQAIRDTANQINNDPNIPDPPKSDFVGKLNAKANQIDPTDKPCGVYVPC